MKSRWIIVLSASLLWTAGAAQPISAASQDVPVPADETQAAPKDETDQKKIRNGLYVEVGYGSNDMDPLDTSARTTSTQFSSNSLTFEDMDYGRAVIGWQLRGAKGRFRLVWQGYTETGYKFLAAGRESSLGVTLPSSPPIVENLDWWQVAVVDGQLTATRTPPAWDLTRDTNMDGAVQQNEVFYPIFDAMGVQVGECPTSVPCPMAADFDFAIGIESNLQNRIQTVDVLYGREFGPRRFEGRWWGGIRYFAYEGTLLQGAWLRGPMNDGDGFTDGLFVRLLHPTQKATAVGPTGSLGFQVNFFNKRVQLFMNGQFGFLLSSVETDTGNFFTLSNGNTNDEILTGVARLTADRSRTSWQTHLDGGARFNTKKGLTIELAYFKDGFLDAVLTPTEIRIPQSAQEIGQGTSAIFATQDLVLDGWRGSVAFQF